MHDNSLEGRDNLVAERCAELLERDAVRFIPESAQRV